MQIRLFLFLMIILANSMCSAVVTGEERSAPEQPPVFTNQDIKKYRIPSDAKTKPAKDILKEDPAERRRNKTERIREEQEMEYWCEKASAYRKKIETADDEVKETERKISEENRKNIRTNKKSSSLQKSLEKARKRLKDAEKDLAVLQQEAHRKGAKPGWLRCQL